MSDNNLNKNKVKPNFSKEDLERLEILQKSEKVKGEQLFINYNSEVVIENEVEKLLDQKIDDPSIKHNLYYKGLANLLKKNLPTGKEFKDVRNIIHDEKIVFITRGAKKNKKGIRGSDSRMAYVEDLEEAIKIVAEWVSRRGTPVELFMSFWNKNEELGYGHQD
jgi:hypothetical protein